MGRRKKPTPPPVKNVKKPKPSPAPPPKKMPTRTDLPKERTISAARYNELRMSERVLTALYSAGVDNWEGFNEAMEEFGIFDTEEK